MRRLQAYVVLATLFTAAGCASAPPEVADGTPAAVAPPTAVAAAEPSEAVATPVTITVVDAHELIAREPPRVFCREILKPGSNVHVRQCLTAEDWKRYERIEAQEALAITRMMQGKDR